MNGSQNATGSSITKMQKVPTRPVRKRVSCDLQNSSDRSYFLCKGFHVSMFFGSDAPIRTLTHEWAMHTPPWSPGGHVSACTPAHAHDFLTPVGMPRSHAEKGFRVCRALPWSFSSAIFCMLPLYACSCWHARGQGLFPRKIWCVHARLRTGQQTQRHWHAPDRRAMARRGEGKRHKVSFP